MIPTALQIKALRLGLDLCLRYKVVTRKQYVSFGRRVDALERKRLRERMKKTWARQLEQPA